MRNYSTPMITGWTQSPYENCYNWESKAIASFRERREVAFKLVSQFNDVEDDELSNAARRNAVVNLVSAIEVYFRDLIVESSFYWTTGGFAELLKEKISLNDAYDSFKNTSITKEALVARYYSFQNIDSIAHVFDRLTGCDFMKRVNEAECLDVSDDECPTGYYDFKRVFPGWKRILVDLLNKRHKIVHEAQLSERVSEDDWEDYYYMASALPYAVEWALSELISERSYEEYCKENNDGTDGIPDSIF